MKQQWIGLVACLTMSLAQAASFDYGKAAIQVEKLICVDQELSKLDEELAAAYADAMKAPTAPANPFAASKHVIPGHAGNDHGYEERLAA